MSYVIAISGPTGSGKTLLARGLVAQLGDACAIHMDNYERMTREPVDKVMQWADRGADFNELSIPLLAEHLERLKRGESVVDPAARSTIASRKYVVFETQFGRAHQASGRHIDCLVWIEAPLEIALARNLKAFTAEALRDNHDGARQRQVEWLDGYLANYLLMVRRLLLLQADRVRPRADVIVDGEGEPETMVRQARDELLKRIP